MQCWDLINRGQGISVVPPQARANFRQSLICGRAAVAAADVSHLFRTQPRSGGGPNIESHLESELE
jgi:hypothetical protein